MMSLEDFKLYLPKYLSPDSQEVLFRELKQFPENIDKRLYTTKLIDEKTIFQGDGLSDLLVVNLPDKQIGKSKSIVISNTCDVDPANERYFPARLCYAPIFSLEKYITRVKELNKYKSEQIKDHINAIKKQLITQIFYLPKSSKLVEDSIVFLDRLQNCDNNFVERSTLKGSRLFSLSDYGVYLFVFKLSLHFTRLNERVDRNA